MTDQPVTPRRYDETEVAHILKRATELHRDEPSAGHHGGGGLSLKELEDIAMEAGIDPRLLRQAAQEVDDGSDRGFLARITGAALHLDREMTIPGELDESDFERIVGVIQARTREHGQPSLLGRTLTWRAETANKSRTIQVVVTSRDGHTTIEVEERLQQLAAGIFGGGVGGIGIGLGFGLGAPLGSVLLGSTLVTFAFPLASAGLAFIGAREVYRRIVSGRQKALAELMDGLVIEVRRAVQREIEPPPSSPRKLSPG